MSPTQTFGDVHGTPSGLSIRRIISEVKPDEVYNLAAQSHVRTSFDQPVYTGEVVAIGRAGQARKIRKRGPW